MSRCGCSEKVYRVRENPAFIDLLEHLFFLSPQKWRITQASGFIFLATMKWLILRFSNRRTLTDAGQYVSKFCRILLFIHFGISADAGQGFLLPLH
jgi:hypothetical protein